MKNEILEFFKANETDIPSILEECQLVMVSNKAKDERAYVMINILSELYKQNSLELFIKEINNTLNENVYDALIIFIKDNQTNIQDYTENLNLYHKGKFPKIVDIDWKFIGLNTFEKAEFNEYIPKILLKLYFNNNKSIIIESDYGTLKKFQEETEECLSYFNSAYSKRIDSFSK